MFPLLLRRSPARCVPWTRPQTKPAAPAVGERDHAELPPAMLEPLGVGNPRYRKMEASGFYDVCKGGRGGSRFGLHRTRTRKKRRKVVSGWPYGVSIRFPRFNMELTQSGLRVSLM